MLTISRDNPCHYITAVCTKRLPIFRTSEIADLLCKALAEARTSGGFTIFAYVIMPDHMHLITDPALKASKTLQFVKGVPSHKIIGHLKDRGYKSSLEKLRHEERDRGYRYSLWEAESNVFPITSESTFMQKVNYIHQNPVRAGLVERAVDYRWSSARYWAKCPIEDEPLVVGINKIAWRSRG